MNNIVPLTLQERKAQCSAGKHDQWQGYMTILVVKRATIKAISIITTVIRPIIKLDVTNPLDAHGHDVKWTVAIR